MKFLAIILLAFLMGGCGATQNAANLSTEQPQPTETPAKVLNDHLQQLESPWTYENLTFAEPMPWNDALLLVYTFTQTQAQQSRNGVGYALMRQSDDTWQIDRGETTGDPGLIYSIAVIRQPQTTNILYGQTKLAEAHTIRVITANAQERTTMVNNGMFVVEIPDNLASIEILNAEGVVIQ